MGIAIAMVTKKDGGLGWINEILDVSHDIQRT